MRKTIALGLLAAAFMLPSGSADAARWCHSGPNAKGCVYRSAAQCQRAVRRSGGVCRQLAQRAVPVAPVPGAAVMDGARPAPGQIYPSRPAWSSPYECFTDDGGGRFRSCNAGDAVN